MRNGVLSALRRKIAHTACGSSAIPWSVCRLSRCNSRRWLSQLNGSLGAQTKASSDPVEQNQPAQNEQEDSGVLLQGEVLDLAADLRAFRPGEKMFIPYELTVTESLQDFWQSAFHAQDRINTSRPFCRKIGLQDRVLPFSLALFLTTSMSHADSALVQVGFGKAFYLWPAFAGDTFTKTFTVESIRNTSDGHNSVIHFTCDLINQRGRLCMRADKRMLFDFSVPESSVQASQSYSGDDGVEDNVHMFRDHILSKADICQELQSHSLVHLRPGQLILHSLQRSLTFTQSQQLASLARLTHEKHFDSRKFDTNTEIMIPGGLVLGITMSASARDFHEILHEEIISVNYVNTLHPGNIVGAISYIQSVEDAVGDLQVVKVRTLGVKNLDVKKDLEGVGLPLELLETAKPASKRFKPKDFEHICKTKCPELLNKIVVQVDRKILRQAPHQEVFLL